MMAIGVPVVEDKIDAWKAWMTDECLGSRKEEFEQFNERMGLTTHRAVALGRAAWAAGHRGG